MKIIWDNSFYFFNKKIETPFFVRQESDVPMRDAIQQSEERSGASLQSLLIQPIQRLPRYQMLLNDLLRNTDAVRQFSCVSLS